MRKARMPTIAPTALAAAAVLALAAAAGAVSPASAQAACANETEKVGDASVAELRTAVVCLTNEARAARGLQPLAPDVRLDAAAQAHALDMQATGYFSHTGPISGSSGDRIRAQGYPLSGSSENMARGQRTPFAVVQAWLQSRGHCTNIFGSFTEIGIGISTAGHWVQNFAVQQGQAAQAGSGTCPASLNRAAVDLPAIAAPEPALGTGALAAASPAPVIRKIKAQGGERRKLRVSVRCLAGRSACTGTVRIRDVRQGTVLGRKSFRIPSGKTRPVSVRLTAAGERRVRRADRRVVLVQLVSPGVPSSGVEAKLSRAR